MFKTIWKPKQEIEHSLQNAKRISIIACDSCAKGSGTGGSDGINSLKKLINDLGKDVIFSDIITACCVEPLMKQAIMKDLEVIKNCDALIIDSCASGVKAAHICNPEIPIIGVLDSVGCVVLTDQDNIIARSICKGCGQCVITYTAGICPLSDCPKRTKYEPCEKALENGNQCTVNPYKNCVWEEIKKSGGDLIALRELSKMHKSEKLLNNS